MPDWILSHSRRFFQLCHVDEFNRRYKNVPYWIYASGERAVWNRKYVRDIRTDVLWTTVQWKELYVSDTIDTRNDSR